MVILDTDFLSSFFKIRKLNLILKTLNLKHITIPSTVYEELKKAKFFDEIISLFAFKKKDLTNERYILVKNVDLSELTNFTEEEITLLGKGELGCFLLANRSGETVFIDDNKARMVAKEKGLKVVSLPSFLLFCKKKGVISLDELKHIVNDLKAEAYYEFTEDVKKTLLE
jgi:predicted nucleic acid-binding protein